jgi:hypothetical protein
MHYEIHDAHLTIDTDFAKGRPTVKKIKTGTESLPVLWLLLTYHLLASLVGTEHVTMRARSAFMLEKESRGRACRVCGAGKSRSVSNQGCQ